MRIIFGVQQLDYLCSRLTTTSRTRMHSSTMRTIRTNCLLGGVCPGGWGCLPRSRVCPGGCLPRGCLSSGECVSQHALGQTPPVDRMANRCKNITFPQLRLRTVITCLTFIRQKRSRTVPTTFLFLTRF